MAPGCWLKKATRFPSLYSCNLLTVWQAKSGHSGDFQKESLQSLENNHMVPCRHSLQVLLSLAIACPSMAIDDMGDAFPRCQVSGEPMTMRFCLQIGICQASYWPLLTSWSPGSCTWHALALPISEKVHSLFGTQRLSSLPIHWTRWLCDRFFLLEMITSVDVCSCHVPSKL